MPLYLFSKAIQADSLEHAQSQACGELDWATLPEWKDLETENWSLRPAEPSTKEEQCQRE